VFLEVALDVGIDLFDFWRMTPRETVLVIQAKNRATVRKYDRELYLIWHLAALERQKKLPTLKQFLAGGDKPRVLKGKELEERRKDFEKMKEIWHKQQH
jgi:hypothetical protein